MDNTSNIIPKSKLHIVKYTFIIVSTIIILILMYNVYKWNQLRNFEESESNQLKYKFK